MQNNIFSSSGSVFWFLTVYCVSHMCKLVQYQTVLSHLEVQDCTIILTFTIGGFNITIETCHCLKINKWYELRFLSVLNSPISTSKNSDLSWHEDSIQGLS